MQKKKLLVSLSTLAVVAIVVVGGTISFFNDTETSVGNIFTAGSIDLKVDHTYATYNGEECVGNCTPEGDELITNGGFETPVVTDNGGQWQVYADGSATSWDVTAGAGLELQRNNVAGAPHSGNQLAELDSHGANSQSTIQQVITTVPGEKYRLSFWHSPRPNNGPDTDNAIAFTVKVTSDDTVLVNDTVGNPSFSNAGTVWTEYTYNFIADDTQTTISFSDAGSQQDTFGGYIDDVSVFKLNCSEDTYQNGGMCTLWGERDLGENDVFWNFNDIKPGDRGTDVISLHVYDNDAYACLIAHDGVDAENGIMEPEAKYGDDDQDGELQDYITFFSWLDNGDGSYNPGTETALGQTTLGNLGSIASLDSGNGQYLTATTTGYVGLAWCAGTISVDGDTGAFGCDGSTMHNDAMSDSFTASLTAYAEQVRNNGSFQCENVQIGDVQTPEENDWEITSAMAGGDAVEDKEVNDILTLTTGDDVNSRIRYSYDTPDVDLNAVTGFQYDSKQVSAFDTVNGNASFRLVVDLNGDGSVIKDVTFEPYYNINAHNDLNPPAIISGIWQTWYATQTKGKFWASGVTTVNGLSGGGGAYATNFTLAELSAAYPNAKVLGVSIGMGTYNKDQVVEVDNLNFNGGMATGF